MFVSTRLTLFLKHLVNVIGEHPLMSSDFRVGRGVGKRSPKIGHFRLKIVSGRGSKIIKNRWTSFIDVP